MGLAGNGQIRIQFFLSEYEIQSIRMAYVKDRNFLMEYGIILKHKITKECDKYAYQLNTASDVF